MLIITHTSTPEQLAQVRDLLREYTSWAFATTAGSDSAPTFEGLEQELATLPGVYDEPDGRLLLATLEAEPAGCVALKRHDANSGEVKRLYVRPGFRGHRVGDHLVAQVIEAAREIGYERLVLDSHHTMHRAHAIYRAAGFHDVETPADFPEHLKGLAVFMEMELVSGPRSPDS